MTSAACKAPEGRAGNARLLAEIRLTSLSSEVYGPSEVIMRRAAAAVPPSCASNRCGQISNA